MRQFIKGLARYAGYDIVRHATPEPVAPFDVLTPVVRERLARNPEFTFVQVGANDGVSLDPVRELVLEHRLRGLLVEPVPGLFDRLRSNYEGHAQLKFECCAIGPREGTGTLYRVRPDAPLPEHLQLIASFDKGHVVRKVGRPDAEEFVEAIPVPMLTLPGVLDRHGIPDPTLLVVDVEGFDGEVVRMALDAGIRPAIIQYEWEHLRPPERAACKHLLVAAGYGFVDVGTDTLAVRTARPAGPAA
ncbi:MAG: hypothetical protein C0501_23945 [Isosphaera sp.]|nr:hypothetical protein [Isosphaera sp.]